MGLVWLLGAGLTGSALAAPGAAAIELHALADGVWQHTSHYTYPGGSRFPSNGLIVREGDALTLVDTAWGELATVELLNAVAEQLELPVTRAIITHYHGDRLAGADLLETRGIEVLALPETRRLAAQHGLPIPDTALEGLAEAGSMIRMGELEVFYPGPAHTTDNLVVWLPGAGVLFGGCMVRAASATSAGNTAHGDVVAWHAALVDLAARYAQAAIVVPGHGETGGLELLEHTAGLLLAEDAP